jgi:hypothetical protein
MPEEAHMSNTETVVNTYIEMSRRSSGPAPGSSRPPTGGLSRFIVAPTDGPSEQHAH